MRVLTGAIAAVTFVGIGLEALRRHLADPDGSFGGHDRATVLDSLRAAAARLSDTLRTLDEAARPLIAHGDGVDGDHARWATMPRDETNSRTRSEPDPPEPGDDLASGRDFEVTEEDLDEARAFLRMRGMEWESAELAAVVIKKLREWDDHQQRRSQRQRTRSAPVEHIGAVARRSTDW
jgi:hypothetical protein